MATYVNQSVRTQLLEDAARAAAAALAGARAALALLLETGTSTQRFLSEPGLRAAVDEAERACVAAEGAASDAGAAEAARRRELARKSSSGEQRFFALETPATYRTPDANQWGDLCDKWSGGAFPLFSREVGAVLKRRQYGTYLPTHNCTALAPTYLGHGAYAPQPSYHGIALGHLYACLEHCADPHCLDVGTGSGCVERTPAAAATSSIAPAFLLVLLVLLRLLALRRAAAATAVPLLLPPHSPTSPRLRYFACCLATLCGRLPNARPDGPLVVSLEHAAPVAAAARAALAVDAPDALRRVQLLTGDARDFRGADDGRAFAAIHVGCAVRAVPAALVALLAPGGRLLAHVGPSVAKREWKHEGAEVPAASPDELNAREPLNETDFDSGMFKLNDGKPGPGMATAEGKRRVKWRHSAFETTLVAVDKMLDGTVVESRLSVETWADERLVGLGHLGGLAAQREAEAYRDREPRAGR